MKNKIQLAILLILIISIITAVYYFFQAKKLQTDLGVFKEEYEELKKKDSLNLELLTIDSLLVEGEYQEALQNYRSQSHQGQQNDDMVRLRIDLANRFLRQEQRIRKARTADSVNINTETITVVETAEPDEIRQYDSLQFALLKANAKMDNMKRQLEEKSFGEYLTFKSSKGSEMHYVGQVKRGKANGRGVALLNTGSRYEGDWKDNMRHGEGTFYWPDGEYYTGEYRNDSRHGTGSYFWPNGEKFIGEWDNDQRNGSGTFYGKDGEIMASGQWKNDELIKVDRGKKGG